MMVLLSILADFLLFCQLLRGVVLKSPATTVALCVSTFSSISLGFTYVWPCCLVHVPLEFQSLPGELTLL